MANIGFTDGEQSVTPSNDTQYIFTAQGLQALAAATITKITGEAAVQDGKSITVFSGDGTSQSIGVGSNINFQGGTVINLDEEQDPPAYPEQENGTFRVSVDGTMYEVPINGFSDGAILLDGTTTVNGHLLPSKDGDNEDNEWNIGSIDDFDPEAEGTQPRRWHNLYLSGDIGASTAPINTLYATNLSLVGNNGGLNIAGTNDGITGSQDSGATLPSGTITGNPNASIHTAGGICAEQNIYGLRVFNAVFNDYAEYRTTIDLTPGHVVIDQDDGSLACSSERLQPGAQVISDTFGHCMGQTKDATTPIAVAGRVLVYPYRPREQYHAGMAVCSAPNGTVDIMTREEIRDYPDCIIGIVSEIPQYETWGSDNVKINGRIWVRIK